MSEVEEEGSSPPVLIRGESTVTNQGRNPTCWNHSASKILTRLIFRTLDLTYVESPECDELYDNTLYDPNDVAGILTDAEEKCKDKGEDKKNTYLKLLVTLFFTHMSMEYLGCLADYNDGVTFRSNPFNYFLTILNGETPIVRHISDFYKTRIGQQFNIESKPIILDLLKTVKHRSKFLVVSFPMSKYDISSTEDKLKEVLNKGLYVSLNINYGIGEFKKFFFGYRDDEFMKPIAKTIKEHSKITHTMTIINYYYTTDKNDKRTMMLIIKNSWGKDWGLNGTIHYSLNDLLELRPYFAYIQPSNLSILSDTIKLKDVEENEDVFDIFEVDENESLLFDAVSSKDEDRIDRVNKLLEKGVNINAQNLAGDGVLYMAIDNDDKDMVSFLLDIPDIDVNIVNELNWTPLCFAIYVREPDIVDMLLKKGADVNIQPEGSTLLTLAKARGTYAKNKKNGDKIIKMLTDAGVTETTEDNEDDEGAGKKGGKRKTTKRRKCKKSKKNKNKKRMRIRTRKIV
jgi:hypothetical protein